MTVFQYHQLNEAEQLDTLEHSGTLLAERDGRFCHVRLYQIEDFYIEVYQHMHFNVVVHINCFTDTDYLEPYLKAMDVDALVFAS